MTEEASADVSVGSGHEAGVYYCHQGSCIWCLLQAFCFDEILASVKMYSVGRETLPYGLSQTVLQTLLGADVITALS